MSFLRLPLFAAATTAAALGAFTLAVIFLPPAQQLLVALTPTPDATAEERLRATEHLQRYFFTRDAALIHDYTAAEQAHLGEVATIIGVLPLLWAAAALATAALARLGSRDNGRLWLRQAFRSASRTCLATTLGLLAAGSLAFPVAFGWFHRLAFVQAPWSFDPAESRLVVLFTPQYFQLAAALILLGVAGAATITLLLFRDDKKPRG